MAADAEETWHGARAACCDQVRREDSGRVGDLTRGAAAIHQDGRAVDLRGFGGGEVGDERRDFLRHRHAAAARGGGGFRSTASRLSPRASASRNSMGVATSPGQTALIRMPSAA